MKFLQMGWLAKSFLSFLFIIPAWLSIGFLKKNFEISGEMTTIGYFAGTALGSAIVLILTGELTFSSSVKLQLPLAVGLILGAATNLLLFSAIPDAPNPGLPIAIQSSSMIFVFLFTILLGSWLPEKFDPVRMDYIHLVGVLLIFAGVAVIAIRK